MEPWRDRAVSLERYQRRALARGRGRSRTGYINIMLSRFSVKRAPPARKLLRLQPPATGYRTNKEPAWSSLEINRPKALSWPRRMRLAAMHHAEGALRASESVRCRGLLGNGGSFLEFFLLH